MSTEVVCVACRGHDDTHLSLILINLALLSTMVPGWSARPHGSARRSREYLLLLLRATRVAISGRTVRSEPACEVLAGPRSGCLLLFARQVDLHRLLKRLVRGGLRRLLRHNPGIH